jgi:hypothetical protein
VSDGGGASSCGDVTGGTAGRSSDYDVASKVQNESRRSKSGGRQLHEAAGDRGAVEARVALRVALEDDARPSARPRGARKASTTWNSPTLIVEPSRFALPFVPASCRWRLLPPSIDGGAVFPGVVRMTLSVRFRARSIPRRRPPVTGNSSLEAAAASAAKRA